MRGRSRPHRQVLTGEGEEILRCITPVVLGSLLDVGRADPDKALDDAMGAVDDYLAHLSLPLQRQARVTFALLHSLPARVVLLRTWRPWRETSRPRVETFLLAARGSRAPALRRIYGFLHSMIVVGWFDLPLAWEEIGYPGPPAESAALGGGTP